MSVSKLLNLIVITSLLAITSYFMLDLKIPGMPMFHDSNPHIARMIAYHTALDDGQYPPMWAKEVLGGIGSPVMMLNYQLPYMVSEIFVRMGMTIFDSYKLVLALSFVGSGLLMYLALKTRFEMMASYLGAVVYTLAPYRLLDIYVRGALGEAVSFIFPPLLIWGFAKRSWPILILGWAGLFLTHPVASACFSAFFLGYILLVAERASIWTKLKLFFGPYLVALSMAAFNLLPTLALTEYTYYSPTLSDTLEMFPSLSQLIHSPWGYGVSLPGQNDGMSFEIGYVQWILLVIGLLASLKAKAREMRYLIGSCLVAMFFILPTSMPVYKLFNLTAIIDFPWRLLMCIVFATAWIGAQLIEQLPNRLLKKTFLIIAVVILFVQTSPIAHTNDYWDRDLSWFARETGDSYGEYAPRTRVTRDSAPFGERAEFVQGEGEIISQIEKSNWQQYWVKSQGEGEIRINTTYFPGWQIPPNCFVTKRTLSHIDDSGLIGCQVPSGEQIIELQFVAPPVQRVGNLLTLAGIGGYLWILFRSYYPHLTKQTR